MRVAARVSARWRSGWVGCAKARGRDARGGQRARCPPACRRARVGERAPRVARRLLQSCRARLRERSRSLSAIAVTIECVKAERGGACLRCWPVRRLDKHGYIDMGTDSAGGAYGASMGWPTAGPHERCFLPPPPPPPLYLHHVRPTHHHTPSGYSTEQQLTQE